MKGFRLSCIILGCLFVLCSAKPAAGQTTVSPSSISVPRGQSSVVPLTYRFSSVLPGVTALNSARGQFFLRSRPIGTVSVPLVVPIQNRSGTVTETLVIPQHIIERVFRKRSTTFTYQRTFIAVGEFRTVNIPIQIVTGAAAPFSLRRVRLYFPNQRGQITVPRNYPGLKAYAEIRFNGSGQVIGYWQVGRRIIGSFSEYATFGRRITIETPKIPALPTFETGFHTVRLVITRPRAYFKLPEIVYYVTSEVSEPPVGGRIDLGSPQKDASLPFAPAMFQWKKIPLVHAYLIEFREKGKTKPLFSALTREPSYTIPPAALVYFIPGKALLWTVKGFDKQGKTLAISPTRAFSFQDQ